MKFQVTQKNLSNCLRDVTPFSDKNHQLEIIKNIFLKTNKNLLEISATDLEVSIIERIPGSCQKDGSITIPAGLLREYIQGLPSETSKTKPATIDLGVEKTKLKISCQNINGVINGLTPENYPSFPVNQKTKPLLEIKASVLKSVLDQTIFVANKDLSNPILTGVLLHIFNKELYLVSIDRHRLAEKKITNLVTKPSAKADFQILIPATTFLKLDRILVAHPQAKISIFKQEDKKQHILFTVNDQEIEITSSLIEGTYPDHRKLIPDKFITKLIVDKQLLQESVKRSRLFSQELTPAIVLNWQPKATKLQIKSVTSQMGENIEEIKAKITTPPDGDHAITLNAKYLQEALQALEGDQVEINLNSKLDLCLLKGYDKQSLDDYRHAVMPLRL
ncbi:MAG: DNA polymerase III subunit beta [Candidatus Saccharibacteria bacterium]|nr:DNA polymerase III subunit beta [Candidatus Saccharibacteria bacterium]